MLERMNAAGKRAAEIVQNLLQHQPAVFVDRTDVPYLTLSSATTVPFHKN